MRGRNCASCFPCLAKSIELEVDPETVTPATVVIPSAVPVVTIKTARRESVVTVIVDEACRAPTVRMPVVARRRRPIVMVASVAWTARINVSGVHDITGTADSYADGPGRGACRHWCYGEREAECSECDFGK